MLAIHGVGPETAARLLTAVGDNPERLRSEAAFAHLCGAAPIPAPSERRDRHRLNRGATVPPTRPSTASPSSERSVAREVFKALTCTDSNKKVLTRAA
ncbi:IS110 family transposase [Streptomyces sp. NBC_01003]|nr:IS110 family transposase [Streptomyces sp. NBC_01003]